MVSLCCGERIEVIARQQDVCIDQVLLQFSEAFLEPIESRRKLSLCHRLLRRKAGI